MKVHKLLVLLCSFDLCSFVCLGAFVTLWLGRRLCLQRVELFGKTGFLASGGSFVHSGGGRDLVQPFCRKTELFGCRLEVSTGQSRLKMLYLRFDAALSCAVNCSSFFVLPYSLFCRQRMSHCNLLKNTSVKKHIPPLFLIPATSLLFSAGQPAVKHL